MATLKAGLSKLNDAGLVAKAAYVLGKLTAHAATFTTPLPTLLVLTAGKDALQTAMSAAEDGGKSAHDDLRTARKTLKDLLTQESEYVASVAAGDSAKILDGGFDVRKTAAQHGIPSAPVMVTARMSEYTGMVDLDWAPNGARCYQVYITDKDPSNGSVVWTPVGVTTKSQITAEGLVSANYYWFKVVAIGPAGNSPASDVIMGRAA
ncbi:MAG: fibronectin type III domain-containing protein [Flavobacteriales bacterium]